MADSDEEFTLSEATKHAYLSLENEQDLDDIVPTIAAPDVGDSTTSVTRSLFNPKKRLINAS